MRKITLSTQAKSSEDGRVLSWKNKQYLGPYQHCDGIKLTNRASRYMR